MELTNYVTTVRTGVTDAAALADDHTRQVADRLGSAVESATRLALISALTDATAEISAEMAPGSVEVRMDGTEPTFVVNLLQHGDDQPTMLMPESDEAPEPPLSVDDDEPQARLSLRLPQSVKARVDEYAAAEGVSTNTWLLHRVLEALADRSGTGRRGGGFSFEASDRDGTVRFGPLPPLPPNPFPAGFPFGPGRTGRGERRRHRDEREGGSGSVQGWVQ